MAVGRYLSTDVGETIRGFGDTLGSLAGQVIDWQDVVARRADRERRRRLEEERLNLARKREDRYAQNADRAAQEQVFTMGQALLEAHPDARPAMSRLVPEDTRRELGYTPIPGTEIGGSEMMVDPPAGPGIEPGPTTIRTPPRPAAERDPFAGLPSQGQFEFMGGTYQTEEERNQAVRDYNDATRGPDDDGSSFRPTSSDIEGIINPILTREEYNRTTYLVPPEEVSSLKARARERDMDLNEVVAEAQALLAEYPNYADGEGGSFDEALGREGPPEQEGPSLWERAERGLQGLLGVGEEEPEPEPDTVRMPWPRPDEFPDREGMRVSPEAPQSPYTHDEPVEEPGLGDRRLRGPTAMSEESSVGIPSVSPDIETKIDRLLERGVADAAIAGAVAEELGVGQQEALDIVEGRRRAPMQGTR